jgi:site-specific recombinase XerD
MNRADGTIERWTRHVDQFVAWAGERPLHTIRAREIELEFLAGAQSEFEERNGRPMAAATMRIIIDALRSFYKFLDDFDYLEGPEGYFRNPMTKVYPPPIKQKPIDWLQEEEDERLLRLGPKPDAKRLRKVSSKRILTPGVGRCLLTPISKSRGDIGSSN